VASVRKQTYKQAILRPRARSSGLPPGTKIREGNGSAPGLNGSVPDTVESAHRPNGTC
jgi:hypothetical protein